MSSSSDFPPTQLPGSNAGAGSGAVSSAASNLYPYSFYEEFIQPLEDYIKKLTEEIAANPDKKYRSKLGWIRGFPREEKLKAAQALRAGIDSGDKTALNHPACHQGELGKICDNLLRLKPLVNVLRESARSGDVSVIRLLIAAGADLDAMDCLGQTALHLAADKGHVEVVKALAEAGADVNAKDDDCFYTALHFAAGMSDLKVVKVLLLAGADVNAKDHLGRTALHFAAENGHVELSKALETAMNQRSTEALVFSAPSTTTSSSVDSSAGQTPSN